MHRDGPPSHESYDASFAELANRCKLAIEQAPDYYGAIRVVGTITAVGVHNLESVEGKTEYDDVEGVWAQARRNIALCLWAIEEGLPQLATESPADSYRIDDSVTYDPRGGYIGLQSIRGALDGTDTGEVVTVITADVPSKYGKESLSAAMYSKGGVVVHAEIVAIPADEQENFDACVEMFGDQTRATQLFQGMFADEASLDEGLRGLREATLAIGIYSETEIDPMLGHIRRNGLAIKADRDQNNGYRPDRLERLLQFAGGLGE